MNLGHGGSSVNVSYKGMWLVKIKSMIVLHNFASPSLSAQKSSIRVSLHRPIVSKRRHQKALDVTADEKNQFPQSWRQMVTCDPLKSWRLSLVRPAGKSCKRSPPPSLSGLQIQMGNLMRQEPQETWGLSYFE